jgi:hypothetical protein
VACQIIEGEALVIHFDRGHYFSAAGNGARILEVLANGAASASEIAGTFALETGPARISALNAVRSFLGRLVDEGLVLAADTGTDHTEKLDDAKDLSGIGEAGGDEHFFEEPSLQKYTDLEDLLVLDPIHEVMATGWPAR